MRPARSGVHETPDQLNEQVRQQPAFPQNTAGLEITEFDCASLMNAIPGFVWIALPDGGVEFCNQRWLDYTGLTLDQLQGGGLSEAIYPQDKSHFHEKWRAALTQGLSLETELRMRRRDGSYRWFAVRAVPRHGVDGQITRWYGINTEIEELKRAQEVLQKQTFRSDSFFEQAPEAAAVLRTDGCIVSVNNEFTRMFGYEAEKALGRPIDDLIVPEALLERASEYTNQLRDGRRVEVETIRRRKDGSEVRVAMVAVPVTSDSGEQIANYAIYRDITEQKHAEERLRESEARFQEMADTAPVLIWMTGTDGLCNYFNKPWLEFTNRTMEQEVGTGWIEGVHPDDVQGCFDGFLPAFHARKPFRIEYRLKRADGEYRWVTESGIPRYTGAGDFAGYIGSNIDITDLKRAVEERERLRQLESDLAHINRVSMMGELAASLAHEVKQPIAAAGINANACIQWLMRDTPDIAEACKAASRMVNNAKSVADILDRVTSLYRRDNPQRELVNVNEIIREMIVLLREKANRNSVTIRTECDAGLAAIMADRVQLQQVLMNLMLNGIESMKETGGELTVTSKNTSDSQLSISVSDSGIGIAPDRVDNIFEAFFTTKPQGTGMGLSISRKIIESHGGRLWVSANSGRGATFQFTLASSSPTD
ncbi:PAS domain S-box protein [Acidicapsa acidisoli]|uniref:PAS domain S-box protein n=1 Tax=Acidicapsa acidisoli TaxID=1615681 RepID=UPI0021DFAE59|nr:PAS domain S-box protein [Acidicapsa acidisoli]